MKIMKSVLVALSILSAQQAVAGNNFAATNDHDRVICQRINRDHSWSNTVIILEQTGPLRSDDTSLFEYKGGFSSDSAIASFDLLYFENATLVDPNGMLSPEAMASQLLGTSYIPRIKIHGEISRHLNAIAFNDFQQRLDPIFQFGRDVTRAIFELNDNTGVYRCEPLLIVPAGG